MKAFVGSASFFKRGCHFQFRGAFFAVFRRKNNLTRSPDSFGFRPAESLFCARVPRIDNSVLRHRENCVIIRAFNQKTQAFFRFAQGFFAAHFFEREPEAFGDGFEQSDFALRPLMRRRLINVEQTDPNTVAHNRHGKPRAHIERAIMRFVNCGGARICQCVVHQSCLSGAKFFTKNRWIFRYTIFVYMRNFSFGAKFVQD